MYNKVMQCSYRDLESITGIDYPTFIKFRKRLVEKEWFVSVFDLLLVLQTAPRIIRLNLKKAPRLFT
jgi:hypothetical protein